MNYRIIKDNFYSHIVKTDMDIDGKTIYPSFEKAKKALVKYLIEERKDWVTSYGDAIYSARFLSESDIADDQNI